MSAPVVARDTRGSTSRGSVHDPLGGELVDDETAGLLRSPGPGEPLPEELGGRLEQAFGTDLADVRVHTGPSAHDANRAVAARAFTAGSDIFFSAGSYRPETADGQHLLAHEVTHVVQGRDGRSSAAGSGSTPVIGRADDPAEVDADRSADRVMAALRRHSDVRRSPAEPPVTSGAGLRRMAIRRDPPDGATAVVDPAAKAKAKEDEDDGLSYGQAIGLALFTKAVGKGGAPKDDKEGVKRLKQLRKALDGMSKPQREAVAADTALLAKARVYVGDKLYASLLGAVRMYAKPTGGQVPHLSGGEADEIIQKRLGDIAHLKPYMKTAVKAGKKGEGYVAIVGDDDWAKVYAAQNDDAVGGDEELTTNAFIANLQKDRPAMINASRGTRSTAIHESMHRYSKLNVLKKWGSGLNEGMTEYFTRLITDRNGDAPSAGGPSRDNYNSNVKFVTKMLVILGADKVTQEKVLAEIYFSGKTDLLKGKFVKAHEKAKTPKKDIATQWEDFEEAISDSEWSDARDAMP